MEANINTMAEETDAVDRMRAQWARELPEVDTAPMGVVGRLHRLGAILEAELRVVFAEAGLGNGDFDVLAALRRAGAPYRLSPGELADSTMVTSGAVTKRVDRLAAKGLVERSVREEDLRGRHVRLTESGRELVERIAVRHWANEDRLLGSLGPRDRERLEALLRTVLLDLEGPDAGPTDSRDGD